MPVRHSFKLTDPRTHESSGSTGQIAALQRVRNDVGLMPEMWDPAANHGLGNTPQGLGHLALVHAAFALDGS